MLSSRALARPSRLVRFRPITASGSFSSTSCLGPRSRPSRASNPRRKPTGAPKSPSASRAGDPQTEPSDTTPATSVTETTPNPADQQHHGNHDVQKPPADAAGQCHDNSAPKDGSPSVSGASDRDSRDRLFDTLPTAAPEGDSSPLPVPMARRLLGYQKMGTIPRIDDLLPKTIEETPLEPPRKQKTRAHPMFPPLHLPESFQQENVVHIFQFIPRILEPFCVGPDSTIRSAGVKLIRDQLESTLEWLSRHHYKDFVPEEPRGPSPTGSASTSPDKTCPPENDNRADQFLRWCRLYHALAYFHLVLTQCHLEGMETMRPSHWRKHMPSLGALSMHREARLAAQVLLSEPRSGLDIQSDLEKYMSAGEAAVVAPPGMDEALYAHVQDTVLGHLQLGPPSKKEFDAPCTIINISFPGVEGSRDIFQAGHISRELMQYIASAANANLLHLDSRSLAHIVGPYLGQENAWTSGPYSQLAYTTAATGGRLSDLVHDSTEEEFGGLPGFMMRHGMPSFRRIRRHLAFRRFPGAASDQNQSSKWSEKPEADEEASKWLTLKAQAALESILAVVDFSTSENLIVHLDEMVELSLVAESRFLGWKLENALNKLRAKGRNVILVGTMAQSRAQPLLTTRLQALAQTNTVVNLPIDAKVWNAKRQKKLAETQEYINLDHNIANLVHVLQHMVPKEDGVNLSAGKLDIDLIRASHGKSLVLGVLAQQSIFHLATVMVRHAARYGRPVDSRALFGALDSFHKADEARSRYSDVTRPLSLSSPLAAPSEAGEEEPAVKLKVATENEYEEKLVTGIVRPKDINTTFDDVHVPKETIEALQTFTSLSLERPDAFSYGILATDKISGCLLYGPPGTGKTLLVKAVAKDNKASVLEVSGASIRDMWAGNSEKNVRAIFSLARKIEPCVVFLDEADAILGHRSGVSNPSSTIHRDIINQFLKEWDGVTGSKAFVMIATNRPFDLDDAVLRRVPRRILVDLPLQADREAILKILLKGEQLGNDVSLTGIAKATPFYSGSDLKNVCVTAAMGAVKDEMAMRAEHEGPEPYIFPKKRTIHQRHFDGALKEISSSISEDMDTLTAIRKFDQQYGSGRKTNKRARGMGFEVVPPAKDAEEVLVRKGATPVPV